MAGPLKLSTFKFCSRSSLMYIGFPISCNKLLHDVRCTLGYFFPWDIKECALSLWYINGKSLKGPKQKLKYALSTSNEPIIWYLFNTSSNLHHTTIFTLTNSSVLPLFVFKGIVNNLIRFSVYASFDSIEKPSIKTWKLFYFVILEFNRTKKRNVFSIFF